MNKLVFIFCSVFILFSTIFNIKAQTSEEFQKNYLYGKSLIKEQRFEAAAQVFLPLTSENVENPFTKPASFFYALASLKSGDFEASKSMCLQVLQRYPEWEQKDDIYFILSQVYFEQKKPRLALQFSSKITSLKKDVENCKINYLSIVTHLDTLIALQKDFAGDEIVAQVLAKRLMSSPMTEKNKMLLDYLVQEYKIDAKSLAQKRKSIKKDQYAIAVLFPFQLNEIDVKINKRSNQFILDFYEGIRIAIDSLKAKGITVNVYTYDTEKDTGVINKILRLPELKAMDMIIGPVFNTQVQIVSGFCTRNGILNINPFSANSALTNYSEFTYLFQSTLELQAGEAARHAAKNFRHDSLFVFNYEHPKKPNRRGVEKVVMDKNKVIIFYGNDLKDSLLASYHRDSCLANKLNVIHFEKITRDKIGLLKTILGDTIKLGLTNHVFATLSDEVVAANIMSLLEVSRQTTPLITKSDWLNFELISFVQFESRNVYFIHPEYFNFENPIYLNFKKLYVERTGIYPSIYSIQGYELMTYFGTTLNNFGNYFKYDLDVKGFSRSAIFAGYDYSYSYSNRYVPLTRFKDRYLLLMNQK